MSHGAASEGWGHPAPDGKTPEVRLAIIKTASGREVALIDMPAQMFMDLIIEAQARNILPWVRLDQYGKRP